MAPQLIETSFESEILGNRRKVWLQPPTGGVPAEGLVVLLDGEYYVDRIEAPSVVSDFQQSQVTAPFATGYVSHIDSKIRWPESFCNSSFARFIAQELAPWLEDQFDLGDKSVPKIVGGLSLTGLAAAHIVLQHPEVFDGVLCQSASFWWNDNWLVNEYRRRPAPAARFRITCGLSETQEYFEHGPELVQRTSQLSCNRAMRTVLEEKRRSVSYEEIPGGHDIASWKRDLPRSLETLLAD